MAPYKVLNGRKCKPLVCWEEVGERRLAGLKLVQITLEMSLVINECLKTAFNRHNGYTDPKRKYVKFEVSEYIFLKMSLMKEVMIFYKKDKLTPHYVRLFEIVNRVGD